MARKQRVDGALLRMLRSSALLARFNAAQASNAAQVRWHVPLLRGVYERLWVPVSVTDVTDARGALMPYRITSLRVALDVLLAAVGFMCVWVAFFIADLDNIPLEAMQLAAPVLVGVGLTRLLVSVRSVEYMVIKYVIVVAHLAFALVGGLGLLVYMLATPEHLDWGTLYTLVFVGLVHAVFLFSHWVSDGMFISLKVFQQYVAAVRFTARLSFIFLGAVWTNAIKGQVAANASQIPMMVFFTLIGSTLGSVLFLGIKDYASNLNTPNVNIVAKIDALQSQIPERGGEQAGGVAGVVAAGDVAGSAGSGKGVGSVARVTAGVVSGVASGGSGVVRGVAASAAPLNAIMQLNEALARDVVSSKISHISYASASLRAFLFVYADVLCNLTGWAQLAASERIARLAALRGNEGRSSASKALSGLLAGALRERASAAHDKAHASAASVADNGMDSSADSTASGVAALPRYARLTRAQLYAYTLLGNAKTPTHARVSAERLQRYYDVILAMPHAQRISEFTTFLQLLRLYIAAV